MSSNVERILYGDRTLNRYYDDATDESKEGWADIAHEAVRAMNHITSGTRGQGIPAPVAYATLGNLRGMADMLPQLFEQLSRGLVQSLDNFNVYDRKQDATASVEEAGRALLAATAAAEQMAAALSAAQVALNSQGYEESDS